MDEKEDLYIVERILDRRKNKTGQFEYKIKWKGWSTRQSTWEPRQHLEYVSALVKKYDLSIEKLRKLKRRSKMRISCKKINRNDQIIEQKDERVVKQKRIKAMKIDEASEKKTEKQQVVKLNETQILAMKTMQSHDQHKQQKNHAKQGQKSEIKGPRKRIKRAIDMGQEPPIVDAEKQGQSRIRKLRKRKMIRKQKIQTREKKCKNVKQKSIETTNNVKNEKQKKQRIRKKRKQLKQTNNNEQNLETQRKVKSYQKIEPIVIDLQTNNHLKPIEQKQEDHEYILQQQSVSNIWRQQQLCSNNFSSINDGISNVQSLPKNRNFTICKAIDQKIEVIKIQEKAKRGRKSWPLISPKLGKKIQKKKLISKTIKIAPFIVTIAQSESRSHISQHLPQKSEPSQKQSDIEVGQVAQQQQSKSKRRRRKKQKRTDESASKIAEYKMKPKRIRNKRSFAQIFKDNIQLEEWEKKSRNRVEIDDKPMQVQVLTIEQQLKQLRANIEYQMYMNKDGQLGVEINDQNSRKCQIDVQELAHHSPAWLKIFYQNYI